jgi:Protein of unknown function (DUF4239)
MMTVKLLSLCCLLCFPSFLVAFSPLKPERGPLSLHKIRLSEGGKVNGSREPKQQPGNSKDGIASNGSKGTASDLSNSTSMKSLKTTTTTKAKEEDPDGELCLLPFSDDDDEQERPLKDFRKEQEGSKQLDRFVNIIPIVVPVLAYFAYENVAQVADILADTLASRNFVEVDGGSYRAQIIAPAINGIVIPACVVTFATLLSITLSFLRQRQQDIRTYINTEAGELRVLQAFVDAFPEGKPKDLCRTYLIQYTSRLIAESQPTTRYDKLDATSGESEMNGFLTQLIQMEDVREDLRSQSYSAVTRLNSERSERISILQSSFPPLHYAVLTVLALSICSCYLLETDQDILVFLYAVQLKLLWAILVGVFTGFAVVCYDLIDPFQGLYQISSTVNQLYTIRESLKVSACITSLSRPNGNSSSPQE